MKIKICVIILILIIIFPLSSSAFSINVTTDKQRVNKGEEVILIISTEENVIASNFNINYNNKVFELLEGININVAEKEGKVACIYGNLEGKTTNDFKIKFKAIKSGKASDFSIENVKFRTEEQEQSYTDLDVLGVDTKANVEVNFNKTIVIMISIITIIFIGVIIIILKKKNYKV